MSYEGGGWCKGVICTIRGAGVLRLTDKLYSSIFLSGC